MARTLFKEKPVKTECPNCHQPIIGYRNEEGMMKVQCWKCGTVMVAKAMGRRHIQVDIYAPQGQELIDDEDW